MIKLAWVATACAVVTLSGVYFIVGMSLGTLNSRVTDLVGDYRNVADEIGNLREESGYIKGQVDALAKSEDYNDFMVRAESEIGERFFEIELALADLKSELRGQISYMEASENPSLHDLIDDITAKLGQTEELQLRLSEVRMDFFNVIRTAEAVRPSLAAQARLNLIPEFENTLEEYLLSLDEVSNSLRTITSGLASMAVTAE